MEVGLLGPLRVVTDEGRVVVVPAAKQRVVLACLALRVGELVTVGELAEAIWGEGMPANPRRAVQTYVTRLRKLLGGSGGVLQGRPEGYALVVPAEAVDVGRFVALVARGRAAGGVGDRQTEVVLLGRALGLWRGEPLADVPVEGPLREVVVGLSEQRLGVVERRIGVELGLGRHGELVAELRGLVERFPLREGLWALLLVALYRCGRQADALGAYRRVRGLLAEELGIDPGPELQRLHQAILTSDPALLEVGPTPRQAAAAAGPAAMLPRPAQLPMDVADFVGRAGLVERIQGLLGGDGQVPIVAVSGPPGVGKTALVVHVAHRLAERFPDGQVYVDLHGATAGLRPLGPVEVLGRLLRSLGTDPAAIPTGLEEASAAWRSRVAGRRLLLVLDNAADAGQVGPLLPGGGGCGVVVTSRRALVGLPGAVLVQVGVLGAAEAVELLGRVAGQERVGAEPAAAGEVVWWCGLLPLAVRIAGARLAARPAWPVRALAERLADTHRRLDELAVGEIGVRSSLAVSHQQLSASEDPTDRAAAQAFVLLGVLDGPELGLGVAARLLDQPEEVVEGLLERLVDAHLLETPRPGRYRLHDLLRLYARELADRQHSQAVRAAALARALGFYTATAWQSLELLRPGDPRLAHADPRWRKGGLELDDQQSALIWLEAERANLLAAIGHAATTPGVPPQLAIQLTQALHGFFWVRNYLQDWAQVNQTALPVAQRIGDRAAQARILHNLGVVHWRQGNYAGTLACDQKGLAIFRELGDRQGQAASLGNLGVAHEKQGRYEQALACYQESLDIFRELGDRRGQGVILNNLGMVHEKQGRYEQALACHEASLDISRERGDRHGEAISLGNLGMIYERLDQDELALARQHESLAIYRDLGDRRGTGWDLNNLGIVYRRQGRYDQALACHQESVAMRREAGDLHGQAESLREVGVTLRALGRTAEARAHWLEALAILEGLQTTDAEQVRALLADLPGDPPR